MDKVKQKLAALITALVMVFGGVIAFATPASAHSGALSGVAKCEADGTYTVTWTGTLSNYGDHREVDIKVIKHSPAGSKINGVDGQVWLFEWAEHSANHGLPPFPEGGVFTYVQSGIPGTATSASSGYQFDFKGANSGDPEATVKLDGKCQPPSPEPIVKDISGKGEWSTEKLNCEEKIVTHSRESWTAKAESFDGGTTWTEVPGSRVTTTETETVRATTDKECGVKPPQPEPRPDVKTWETQVCTEPADGTATITTHGQNLLYPQVWDEESWSWIEGPAVLDGPEYVVSTRVVDDESCEPVKPPVDEASPSVDISKGCGYAVVTGSNAPAEDGHERLTASLVVYVDGDFAEALAIPAGETQTVRYTFDEDSGDHKVEVRTGPAFGDELLASETVTTDCETVPPTEPPTEEPPTEEPPTTTPPVVTPPVVTPPTYQAPVVKVVPSNQPLAAAPNTLATTGGESSPLALAALGLIGVGTLLAVGAVYRRRKA